MAIRPDGTNRNMGISTIMRQDNFTTTKVNVGRAFRVRAIVACSLAAVALLAICVAGSGFSEKANQGASSGVADPVVLRQADLSREAAHATP